MAVIRILLIPGWDLLSGSALGVEGSLYLATSQVFGAEKSPPLPLHPFGCEHAKKQETLLPKTRTPRWCLLVAVTLAHLVGATTSPQYWDLDCSCLEGKD